MSLKKVKALCGSNGGCPAGSCLNPQPYFQIAARRAATFTNQSNVIFPTERAAPWAALSKQSDNGLFLPGGQLSLVCRACHYTKG
jgi:hypothetical protein